MSQPAENLTAPPSAARFDWTDPLLLEDLLSEEERMIRDSAREFAQAKLAPRVLAHFRENL